MDRETGKVRGNTLKKCEYSPPEYIRRDMDLADLRYVVWACYFERAAESYVDEFGNSRMRRVACADPYEIGEGMSVTAWLARQAHIRSARFSILKGVITSRFYDTLHAKLAMWYRNRCLVTTKEPVAAARQRLIRAVWFVLGGAPYGVAQLGVAIRHHLAKLYYAPLMTARVSAISEAHMQDHLVKLEELGLAAYRARYPEVIAEAIETYRPKFHEAVRDAKKRELQEIDGQAEHERERFIAAMKKPGLSMEGVAASLRGGFFSGRIRVGASPGS